MRLSRLLCSPVSANVRAFPLTGEGRLPLSGGDVERSETEGVGDLAEGQTDEGEAEGLLYVTNQRRNYGEIFRPNLCVTKRKKMTQQKMADFCGIQLRSYQAYEYNNIFPEVPRLLRLADYFNVSLDYLMGRSDVRDYQRSEDYDRT